MKTVRRRSYRKLLPVVALATAATVGSAQSPDVLTWHNDLARTGQNQAEALLTPGNVNPASFGLRYNFLVDGKVDAQPLYAAAVLGFGTIRRNVVYLATEHDSLYAVDADTGQQYWRKSMLGAGETPSDPRNCGQVTPEIGITATPTIDRGVGPHGTIYLVAMTKDGGGSYHQRIHALDLLTGAEQFGGPVEVQATYPGTGDGSSNGKVVFDPKQYKERPGLLVAHGTLYTSWGSHCDIRPYTGWTIAYSATTLKQTAVFDYVPNGSDAAPWNAGAGPTMDAQGNLYTSLGNGTFDGSLDMQGLPIKGDFGNSLVKLSTKNGRLTPTDYWTMYDTISESGGDVDLGSGGAMNLPDQIDANGKTRHLIVAAGKDANLYVADRDHMGHFDPSSNATLYQELPGVLPGGAWSSPAYFNGSIFYGPVGNALRAFGVRDALVTASPTSQTRTSFNYPGTTPSVSANGTGQGIVWATENTSPAVLHAYDATDLNTELYNSKQAPAGRDTFGNGNKFIAPTIANGKVFVGTTNSVAVFGLLTNGKGPIADGDYVLQNLSSTLRLDNPRSNRTAGVQMDQWPGNSNFDQSWFFSAQGDGSYTIQNTSSGLFLTQTARSGEEGAAPLLQETASNDNTQRWSLIAHGNGYIIRNQATGYVISDPDANPARGTGIVLSPENDARNQLWKIQ